MPAKMSPLFRNVLALLLASALAPLGVRHFDIAPCDPSPPAPPSAATPTAPAQPPAPATARIRATGDGPTAEAAFQSALDDALRQAVAAEVTAADWQRHGQTYLATVRQNGTGVVRGWREVASGSERRLMGRVFHSDVSVEVDVKVLRERLKLAGP